MSDSVARKRQASRALQPLLAVVTTTIEEALRSLIDRELHVQPGELQPFDAPKFVAGLQSQVAVVRGTLEKGRLVRFLFDAADATALAAFMMMTPEDVVTQRRARGRLEGEELEAFADVGNVLCSAVDALLRQQVGLQGTLRIQDHGVLDPGTDPARMLGDAALQSLSLRLRIAAFPESTLRVLLETPTLEEWKAALPAKETTDAGAIDDPEEDIPQAPIRGRLAAYLTTSEAATVVRKSCRRVGLELSRFGKTDIPNPAAHKNHIVVLDLPSGEDRRFEWCKRLKHFHDSIKVVLLIHYPSRSRVLQAALVQADVILGWPVTEELLSQKLDGLLTPDQTPPAAPAGE